MDGNPEESTDSEGNVQIKSTFELLARGEKEIRLTKEYRDLVLVLGNTGSGKSTFTQWIAGDNDKLIAVEVKEGTGEYIIVDSNRIGNSTIFSKTTFPELVIDTQTKTAFYDCPGFSDTRSTSNDIAATYFIKRLVDHAKSVKLIFIVSYPSVRKGVDRQEFMKFVKHATDFLKDIEKFQNSIALIISKVDNHFIKQGKSYILVPDDKVVEAIGDFLQDIKQDLNGSLKQPDISIAEQKFYIKAIKLIDVFLVKKQNKYMKIGIFRRPDEGGPLSKIDLLQEGKVYVKNIINWQLNFTPKVNDDFGYTLSEKSKNDIHDLVEEINKNVWTNGQSITEMVYEYFHGLVEQLKDKIKSCVTSKSIVELNQQEAHNFSSTFSSGYEAISSLVSNIQNLNNMEELAVKMNSSITSLGIMLPDNYISNIANQGKYFNFLKLVTDKELKTRPWGELFKDLLMYFSESRNSIQYDVETVAKQINIHLNETAKVLHKLYDDKMNRLEIQILPAELSKAREIILDLSERLKTLASTEELLEIANFVESSLGFAIEITDILIIAYQEKYFNFLQVISDKNLTTDTLTWICPLKDIIPYLDESKEWYSYLNGLSSKLSEYRVQKNRSLYNVADIEDWRKPEKPQGIAIVPNNFQKFLNKTVEFNVTEYDNIRSFTVTESKLNEINYVLNIFLKHRMDVRCKGQYTFLIRNFINMEDVIPLINNKPCTDGRVINIFALNKVFIDGDMYFPGLQLPITVIAPQWEVIGTRKVELSGSAPSGNPSKAKDGELPGARGADGMPGEPGGPAGSFFGVALQVVNGEKLTITANGGLGGPGQDGGNGRNGTDGTDAKELSQEPCETNICEKKSDLCCNFISSHTSSENQCFFRPSGSTCYVTETTKREYSVKITENGQNGGDGGNGGRGGSGGNPGKIILFELNNNSEISIHNDPGKEGENGRGGFGGKGGKNGDDLKAFCTKVSTLVQTPHSSYKTDDGTSWSHQKVDKGLPEKSGKNGINGANTEGMIKPNTPDIIIKPARIVNEYKSYFRNNLADRFQKYSLTQFINQLDRNSNITNLYNTVELVEELQHLEGQFYSLNKNVDFLPFYHSLLTRVSEYARQPAKFQNSLEHKKVLSFLYTAILGRIYNLKDSVESNLIINVITYLDTLKEDMDTLKELQKSKNKIYFINKYKEDFKQSVDTKVKEAEHFIMNAISPEIDNIGSEIDSTVDFLINEVIQLQKEVKEEKEKLVEKKQKLQEELQHQSVFNIFKIIGKVVSLLGPWGAVTGSVIESGSSIAESLTLQNHDADSRLTIPQSVSDLLSIKDEIISIRDQKLSSLMKLLEQMSKDIEQHPEGLGSLSKEVTDIKDTLSKVRENEFHFQDLKEIQHLKDKLKAVVRNKKEELISIQKDSKTKSALAVIDKFKDAIKLSEVFLDVYHKYKSDRAKVDELTQAILEAENKFNKLKEYEENIYSSIAPLLQNVLQDLNNVQSKLGTKSKVALDVTKWQVQSTLRKVRVQMLQLTEGFKVKGNLVRCIEKLDEAITTQVNIYEYIQDFQDQQKFADFIADVSSSDAENIEIHDKELRDAVNILEIMIRSSLVLQRYQVAIDAFKQFVFPFAHLYIKEIVLPSHLKLGDNNSSGLENLVERAMSEINHIKSKLTDYKSAITKHDEYIGSGEFSSHFRSSKPFFTWKNNQYKNTIAKLLSGEEVVVKADITSSAPDKDAIKFNVIELNFKAKTETLQSKINSTLDKFEISATHLGNSYYRYNNKIYTITTNSHNIWYYFEKNHYNEPVHKGGVYEKIKNGEFMLSPYASWKIKLTNLTSHVSFKDLEIYKDEIDLELGGNGHYVNMRKVTDLDLKVDNYYTPFVTSDQIILNEFLETVDTVSMSKYSDSARRKRAIYQDSETVIPRFEEHFLNNFLSSNNAFYISSPINLFCNWVKERSIAVVSIVFSLNLFPSWIGKFLFDSKNYFEMTLREKVTAVGGKCSNDNKGFGESAESEQLLGNAFYEALDNFPPIIKIGVVEGFQRTTGNNQTSECRVSSDFLIGLPNEECSGETAESEEPAENKFYGGSGNFPTTEEAGEGNLIGKENHQISECQVSSDFQHCLHYNEGCSEGEITKSEEHTDDIFYDALDYFAPIIEEGVEAIEMGERNVETNKSTYANNDLSYFNDNFQYNYSKLDPSNQEYSHRYQIVQNLDGCGLLMIADVITRLFTKEKYEEAKPVVFTAMREKAIKLHHLDQKVKEGIRIMTNLYGNDEGNDFHVQKQCGWKW